MSATLVIEFNEIIQDNGQMDLQILHYPLKHLNMTEMEGNWMNSLEESITYYTEYINKQIQQARQEKFDSETGE